MKSNNQTPRDGILRARAVARQLLRAPLLLPRLAWRAGAHGIRPAALMRLAKAGTLSPSALVALHAGGTPDRIAIVCGDRRLTYDQLEQAIAAVAAELSRRVQPGDRVVVQLPNLAENLIAHLALGRSGAAAVAVSPQATPRELRHMVEHAEAKGVVHGVGVDAITPILGDVRRRGGFTVAVGGDAHGSERWEDFAARAEVRPTPTERLKRRLATLSNPGGVLVYTSGTTGKPKAAVRRFGVGTLLPMAEFLLRTPIAHGQVHLVACPLYHSTAYAFAMLALAFGNTLVLMPRFSADNFAALVRDHQVTHTAIVPTMLHRLLLDSASADIVSKVDTLKAAFIGGAPLSADLARRSERKFGRLLYQFYGATELGLVSLATPEHLSKKPDSVGVVLPGNEVRIVRKDGVPCAPGEIGKLYVRSSNLINGYLKDDAKTAEAMDQGFFSVGDLASLDAEGALYVHGRSHDMIISGGVNVYPREVEDVLLAHPGVQEAAVVPAPDTEFGQLVHAFVVCAETVDEADLRAHCRSELQGAKRPRIYHFVPSLPRNPTGKVLKRELTARITND